MITCVSIAKNEAENIGPFIQSLDGLYDSLIIVDTGSTDDTVKIAKEYGAEVVKIKWENFGQARQEASELVKDGWIVMFDCDVTLREAKKLRSYIGKVPDDIDVIRIMHNGPCNHIMQHERIWRAGKAVWKFRVHERLCYQGKLKVIEDIKVVHPGDYGRNTGNYMADLLADVQDHPLDAGRNYYLGREYYYANDIKGIEYLCKCGRISQWPEEAAMALVFAARLICQHIDREMGLYLLKRAIKKAPHMREPLYTCAQWALDEKLRKLAAIAALSNERTSYFDCEPHMYEKKATTWLNKIAS